MAIKANVLVLDIETAPILAYVWDLYDQNVAVNQIHTDRYIMAWSAKWLGAPKTTQVYYDKRDTPPGDDKGILKPLWELLNEADVVITQNGQNFDSRRINARFMFHRMKPPKPYKHFDTYQLARRVADFTSNKLEYLAANLNTTHVKSYHRKYPGFALWRACLEGKIDAWNEMKKYNIADVLATEELYTKVRAWAPETFPDAYLFTDRANECGTCGHRGKMLEGHPRHGKVHVYRQHRCPKCGAWQKGKTMTKLIVRKV
jgi:DNA polymerase elongation subunit (family B)